MKDKTLQTTIDARGVATLTLNRPDTRNAFDEEMISAICDAFGRYGNDGSVRAIVMTGAGKAFCAGADLSMMQRAAGYSTDENRDDARRLAYMLHSINNCPKPVIARVNGPAMGGGVGIVAACDIAVASEDAFFALSEVRLGLIPAVISPFVVQAIRPQEARRWFLTGERFAAETAKRIGLVHMVAMGAQLDATIDALLQNILAGGPHAQKEIKSLINAVAYRPIDAKVMEDTANRIATVRASSEGKEGIASFLEKRKPNWVKDT
ncbi:MAG: enoyl-CoA hydratase/isomerase family protein [Alphaproteobacteria bacterium]|nr:enoyl-CoA hydratase/isomerase family protein [Alphaproteobacteria bacterium]